MPTIHSILPHFLEAAGTGRCSGVNSTELSHHKATANSRENTINPPLNAPDPFFRGLDATLATEARIRSRANEILRLIICNEGRDAWQIGGPDAQIVEMKSAHRIIQESLDREYAECTRALGSGA